MIDHTHHALAIPALDNIAHELRADLAAVSDGYYLGDLSTDIFVREIGYLRSTASLSHRLRKMSNDAVLADSK